MGHRNVRYYRRCILYRKHRSRFWRQGDIWPRRSWGPTGISFCRYMVDALACELISYSRPNICDKLGKGRARKPDHTVYEINALLGRALLGPYRNNAHEASTLRITNFSSVMLDNRRSHHRNGSNDRIFEVPRQAFASGYGKYESHFIARYYLQLSP